MVYEWSCPCGITKAVTRTLADYLQPPDDPCECGAKDWKKLPASRTIVNGSLQKGSYNSGDMG